MFSKRSLSRFLLAIVILSSSLAALPSLVNAQATPQVCQFPFEATVLQGQSKGTSVSGDMTLNIDQDGGFTGTLVRTDKTEVPVSGQITGRAINLVMELARVTDDSAGSYVYGTGVALNPIMGDPDCGGPLGGTFAGPKSNDLGSWGKVTVCVTYDGVKHCASIEIILT
jgi:hypothetical protein